jgi:hypothetical protein
MHFGGANSQLLPFCEYLFAPGKSPVEVQPEILDIFFEEGVCCVCELGDKFLFVLVM